jgi:malonate decarboxylase epsilon subunit
MEEAYPDDYGLTAIIGLDERVLGRLVERIRNEGLPVYLAGINSDTQMTIAGSEIAMHAVAALAREHGARQCLRLDIAVPSHCPLLADAANSLSRAFDDVILSPPHSTYISSNLARAIFDPRTIATDLSHNMASPVLWRDSVRLTRERGARLMVEMPGGGSLTRLAAETFPERRVVSFDDSRLDTLIALIERERVNQPI